MEDFKYGLEPYRGMSSRYTCPSCGTKKAFVTYIDKETNNQVGDDIGRCNREQHCGYHKAPESNGETFQVKEPIIIAPTDYLDTNILTDKVGDYLYKFLAKNFKTERVKRAYLKYRVFADDSKYEKATVYPQIDLLGRIRTAKIMLYDNYGKRIKYPYSVIGWMHKELRSDFQLEQCLFGEHLLIGLDPITALVGLVESEKTALILSIKYPAVTWVASGGMSNLSQHKLNVLKPYRVTAYPDKGAYDYWNKKLSSQGYKISRVLEMTDFVEDGEDLADYIMKNIKD